MPKITEAKFIDSNVSGIYMITSPSGLKYVGQSACIKSRLIDHKCPSRKKLGHKISLEFRKYPLDLFVYEILETCEPSALNEREMFWIKSIDPELNISIGGNAHNGCKVSDEMKLRLRDAGKRQWDNKTPEDKQKIIRDNLTGRSSGFSHSKGTKEKISKSLTGKKQSSETKEKRSLAMKVSMIGNKNGEKSVASVKGGEIVKIYDSLLDASLDVGIDSSGISKVLSGRQLTAGGYSWKLVG